MPQVQLIPLLCQQAHWDGIPLGEPWAQGQSCTPRCYQHGQADSSKTEAESQPQPLPWQIRGVEGRKTESSLKNPKNLFIVKLFLLMADQDRTWEGFPQPVQGFSRDWSSHMLLQTLPEGGGPCRIRRCFSWSWSLHRCWLLCHCCRKVFTPRANVTLCCLISSHTVLENLPVAGRI